MAEVKDYTTGKVLDGIRQVFRVLASTEGSLENSQIGDNLLAAMRQLDPRLLTTESASRLIRESAKCAVGERVCRSAYKDTPLTESVFLDELAEGMVDAGKAKYVTQEEAIAVLGMYPKYPTIVSKVSGKHMEICNTWPKTCVYWSQERRGLKCIARPGRGCGLVAEEGDLV
ncbi:MAG: hypothetical protein HY913_14225 [Desulfomonile tiedjei]|nr:hypothetical protein [Desulfomonile tiedjei]